MMNQIISKTFVLLSTYILAIFLQQDYTKWHHGKLHFTRLIVSTWFFLKKNSFPVSSFLYLFRIKRSPHNGLASARDKKSGA